MLNNVEDAVRTVTSPVAYKHTYKGLQPLNGKLMMFDIPFERPTVYEVVLDSGHSVVVSKEYFESIKTGDLVSTEVMEMREYVFILLFILVGVIGGITLFLLFQSLSRD